VFSLDAGRGGIESSVKVHQPKLDWARETGAPADGS